MYASQQTQALLQTLSPEQLRVYNQLSSEQKQAYLQRLAQHQQHHQQQQTQVWHRVSKTEIDSAAYDPLDPVVRYHDGVFVEHDPDSGKGTLHHVTGDIIAARGMRYEERRGWTPGQSANLQAITFIGYVSKADFDAGRISDVLRALPTPPKQQGLNFWERNPRTGMHDVIWTKEDGEPYAPGEPRRPIFKCNEWTAQYAIPALWNAKLLRSSIP